MTSYYEGDANLGDDHYRSSGIGDQLRDIWQVAWRRKWLIAFVILVSALLGLIATLLAQPKFTASARIEISRQQQNLTSVEDLEEYSASRDPEFYETQYALLEAESLAKRVARSLDLTGDDQFFEAHQMRASDEAEVSANLSALELASRKEEQVVQTLLSNVVIAPVARSSLVDITYTSGEPALSQSIANAWVEQFIESSMDRQFESTADARQFLQKRLVQLRARLEESERSAAKYASDRDIVILEVPSDAGNAVSQRTLASTEILSITEALNQARADRIEAESLVSVARLESSPEFLQSNTISTLQTRRAQVAGEYEKILVQFQPTYAGARELKRELDVLDAAISRETNRFAVSRNDAVRSARQREVELQGQLERIKSRIGTERQNMIEYNIRQRDVDTNRQLYDALLQRFKEIGVAGAVGVTNIALVDAAKKPLEPSSPNIVMNLLIALALGLGCAGILVFILEQLDDGIRSPDDVKVHLGQPVLGNIPDVEGEPLELFNDPKADIYEAFVTLSSILALSTNHGVPKSLTVTSTSPGEGKSTSAYGLARTLARMDKKVVLVDGDLRSPSINEFFGMPLGKGLSNLLANADELEELIHKTNAKGLDVITAGPMPPNPAELLNGDHFSDILEKLCEKYDHVVVDAPPVLGLADAPLICKAVEGAMFVVRAEETSRRAARRSIDRLRQSGANLFGVIVTRVDLNRNSYGYGYGYGYGYKYGDDAVGEETTVPTLTRPKHA